MHFAPPAVAASPPPCRKQLCRGSGIAFPAARKLAGKPPALQARLDELRARLEQQQYDRMVHDVTHEERKAKAAREGGLVTYKQQVNAGWPLLWGELGGSTVV